MPLGLGVFLVWQEWHFRAGLIVPQAPVEVALSTPLSGQNVNADAIASVLGLAANVELLPSAEPLLLHASFIVINGVSKALIADAQGSRIYQMGETLPGGSVLRRIEPDRVVLWSKGREEVLALLPSATPYLRRAGAHPGDQAGAVPARFLRPSSGPSE
ncbi:Type IV pilus biogenesis [Pseudomonas vancouverensis]|uniref:Type II secretion system protein GspC N-terminal domain-containing protein n=2 Tax=Pseudomonas vancouverensis TaxID=95300 RepID=A0A1H2PBG8_PSEVA|nr:hypothetical protein F7R09_22680 [Pseudomonas vancouverensis]TDB58079.1 hypothetical protein EIY72_23855 [Pseudomonas vancouverensis]SDV15040.1 Type IV pilus biogenesis [Pseudomonas vancouverensis]